MSGVAGFDGWVRIIGLSESDNAISEAYLARSATVQGCFDTRTASARPVDSPQGAKVSRAGRSQACRNGDNAIWDGKTEGWEANMEGWERVEDVKEFENDWTKIVAHCSVAV